MQKRDKDCRLDCSKESLAIIGKMNHNQIPHDQGKHSYSSMQESALAQMNLSNI